MPNKLFKSLRPHARTPILPVTDYQFHDRISNSAFLLALFLIVVAFLLVWWNFAQLPPELPLYLQRPWGNLQLAPKNMLWVQPGLLVIFFLLNYAISLFTMKNEPLVARILGGTVLICSVMSLLSIWNILNLLIVVKLWF